jgi:hypothetical protein
MTRGFLDHLRLVVARFLLRILWSVGGTNDAMDSLPRLRGAEAAPLLSYLRTGDVLLLGNNGMLSHAGIYVGDGRLIHAMATEKTMRGWSGALSDAVSRLFGRRESLVGVIEEPLLVFLDRFERDTIVVVRHPALVGDKLSRGIARVRSLLGRPYDYLFARRDDGYYCTELVEELWEAGLGPGFTPIATRRAYVPLLLDRDVIEPAAILSHPDIEIVVATRSALKRYAAAIGGAPLLEIPGHAVA